MNAIKFAKEITSKGTAIAFLKLSTLGYKIANSEIQTAISILRSEDDNRIPEAGKHIKKGMALSKHSDTLRAAAIQIHNK